MMRRNTGKTIVEMLEVIREVDKNERSRSKIAQDYGSHSPLYQHI
jgi:hypothetical protein